MNQRGQQQCGFIQNQFNQTQNQQNAYNQGFIFTQPPNNQFNNMQQNQKISQNSQGNVLQLGLNNQNNLLQNQNLFNNQIQNEKIQQNPPLPQCLQNQQNYPAQQIFYKQSQQNDIMRQEQAQNQLIQQNNQQNQPFQNNNNNNNNNGNKINQIQQTKNQMVKQGLEQHNGNNQMKTLYDMYKELNKQIKNDDFEKSKIQGIKNSLAFPFITQDDFSRINAELQQKSQYSRIQEQQSDSTRAQMQEAQQQSIRSPQNQKSQNKQSNIGIQILPDSTQQESQGGNAQSQNKPQQYKSSNQKQEVRKDNQQIEKTKNINKNQNQNNGQNEEDIFDIIKDFALILKIESVNQFSEWKKIQIKSQEKFQLVILTMYELFQNINNYNSQISGFISDFLFKITSEHCINNALKNFLISCNYESQTIKCFFILTEILQYLKNVLNLQIRDQIVQNLAANVEQAYDLNQTQELQCCLNLLNKIYIQIKNPTNVTQNQQKQPSSNQTINSQDKMFEAFAAQVPTQDIQNQQNFFNKPQNVYKNNKSNNYNQSNKNQIPQQDLNQQMKSLNQANYNMQINRQQIQKPNLYQNVDYTLPIITKVIPTLKEIMENRYQDFEKYLIPIPKNEKFNSIAEYLSVNYYLMREDFLLCPRQFLQSVISDNRVKYSLFNQDFRSQIYVYYNIRVVNIKFYMDNFFVELKAQPMFMENRSCQFSNSKRLMHGSLIIICDESTKKQFLGLVSYLDRSIDQIYQTRQTVKFGVKIINTSKQDDSTYFKQIIQFLQQSQKNTYFAFEPRNFWQSSYHCLKEIRKMSKIKNISIPFKDIIIEDNNLLKKPEFINQQTTYKFQNQDRIVNFNLNFPWPNEMKGSLDDSQFKALQNMLTKSISLIQGPPGTGKTFIGIIGVKILLQNWEVWNNKNSPILIICKTNHALDQFLNHILQFEKRIVRIGTRCQLPALKDYLIGKFKPKINNNLKQLSKKMNQYINSIVKSLDQVHKIPNFLKHYEQEKINILDFVCSEFLLMIQIQVNLSEDEKLLIFDRWWRNRFDESLISDISKSNLIFREQVTKEKKQLLKEFFDNRFNAEKQFYEQRKQIKKAKKLQAKEELERSVNYIQQDSNIIDDNEMDEGLIDNLEFKQILQSLEYEDYELNEKMFLDFVINKEKKGLYLDFVEYMNVKIFGFKKQQEKSIQDLMKQFSDYKIKSKQYKQEKKKFYTEILKKNRIAGMTLTGSQMNMDSLRELQYQIIILEEAGQILETHLIPLLKPCLQQIIMIGDHQQLKPSVSNYQIEQQYNYNQSMLERLISKGVEYVELNTQRRMRNEFSNIIRLFYPKLQDHFSVAQYQNVKGIQKNFLFLSHSTLEKQMKNRVSMSNEKEAQLVVNLVKYILDQKQFQKKQITVLSMYQGQCRLLKQQLSLKLLSDVQVSTVDNYQGEENDIIILSLVRSNQENEIGFLKNSNRINVGFSRAKVGFYVLGNFDMFKNQAIDFWQDVTQYCEKNSFLEKKIISKCSQHNATINISLENNEFYEKSPNGGCLSICNKRRKCNHQCQQQCHNGTCEQQICNQPCSKPLPCSHQCKRKCSEKCGGFCNVQVEKTIQPCGHKNLVKCGDDIENFQCKVMVQKVFECNHQTQVECYKQKGKLYCNKSVQFQSACGNMNHTFQIICGLQRIYKEKKICNFLVLKHCDTCNQSGKVQCSRQNEYKCQIKVQKQLMCSHSILVVCSEQKTILDQPCENNCQKILGCKHQCTNLCSQKCSKCKEKKQFLSYCCNEQMIVSCAYKQAMLMDQNKKFPCKCNTNICKRHFKKQKEKYGQQCEEVCGEVLPCSHTCKSKCKDCLYGLLHQNCNESVEKTLACGHKATIPCSQSVLYNNCNQPVEFMTCQQNQQHFHKCFQKNKINEALAKLQNCKQCKDESVLILSCNHDINFPYQYFDYQYSRKPFTIPVCKQPNCGKQLVHHAFTRQICDAFKNINNIEEQISREFDHILQNFEEQTKQIQIQNPYGAIENEEKYYLDHENKEQRDTKQSQIIKLRTCILKQIISDYEKLLPYIESMWIQKSDDSTIQIMCQAFKNIENLYFQFIDKCRIQFYHELHKKMNYFAIVIFIHFKNEEHNYKELLGFPFDPSSTTQEKVLQNSKFQKQFQQFSLNDILKLGKIQMKKCQNNHIVQTENQYCDHKQCYQILQDYEIIFDI
ncbi:hypothetical protein ABPG72_014832 [Tetrahymena utriculariae]